MNESYNKILTRTSETPQIIHVLGPKYSFSDMATKLLIDRGVLSNNSRINYAISNPEVVETISKLGERYTSILPSEVGNAINLWYAGVIPVGNSYGGTVDATLNAMHNNNNLVIVRQDSININQVGGINPDSYLYERVDNRTKVTTIASHKQAIAQTEQEWKRINMLRLDLGLNELIIKETESTTAGIELAKLDPSIMAIGTKDAIKENGLNLYNDGIPMSLSGNVTKFNLIRAGNLDPYRMVRQVEDGHIQTDDLSGRDTIMLQATIPNKQGSEYSLLKILSDKYKLNIIAKNWRHNGLPKVAASEVIELNGLEANNPNKTYELIRDLRNWCIESEGLIKILGIYKSANIYDLNDRNALD